MTDGAPAEAWTWLARIRHPQGRKGEVFAELLTDFPEKFSERRRLWLIDQPAPEQDRGVVGRKPAAPRAVQLSAHWLHKGGVVLHFAGVGSISAAEKLSGLLVAVPQAERVVLPGDETYIGDLIGCAVVDVTGAAPVAIGEIEDVDRSAGPVALLVVRGRAGELLIPFVKSYLRKIDLAARRVEMQLPGGLLEINAPEKR